MKKRLAIAGIVIVLIIGILLSISLLSGTEDNRFNAYLDRKQTEWVTLSLDDETVFSWPQNGIVTVRFDETSGPLDIDCAIVPAKENPDTIKDYESVGLQESISVSVQKDTEYKILVRSSSQDFANGTIWCDVVFKNQDQ